MLTSFDMTIFEVLASMAAIRTPDADGNVPPFAPLTVDDIHNSIKYVVIVPKNAPEDAKVVELQFGIRSYQLTYRDLLKALEDHLVDFNRMQFNDITPDTTLHVPMIGGTDFPVAPGDEPTVPVQPDIPGLTTP